MCPELPEKSTTTPQPSGQIPSWRLVKILPSGENHASHGNHHAPGACAEDRSGSSVLCGRRISIGNEHPEEQSIDPGEDRQAQRGSGAASTRVRKNSCQTSAVSSQRSEGQDQRSCPSCCICV